jgi:hypothetical protein
MGCGHYPGFTARIFPFADAPTVPIPVVFYAVPAANPDGPATPFVDRFWDNREGWLPLGIGTDPTSFKPYFGVRPGAAVGPLVGSAAEWSGGLSYARYLQGLYTNPNGCALVSASLAPAKVQQKMGVVVVNQLDQWIAGTPCDPIAVPRFLRYSFGSVLGDLQTGWLVWDSIALQWVSNVISTTLAFDAALALRPVGGSWSVLFNGGATGRPVTVACRPFVADSTVIVGGITYNLHVFFSTT